MLIREKRITTMTNKSRLILVTSLAVGLLSTLALWLASGTVNAQQPDVVPDQPDDGRAFLAGPGCDWEKIQDRLF